MPSLMASSPLTSAMTGSRPLCAKSGAPLRLGRGQSTLLVGLASRSSVRSPWRLLKPCREMDAVGNFPSEFSVMCCSRPPLGHSVASHSKVCVTNDILAERFKAVIWMLRGMVENSITLRRAWPKAFEPVHLLHSLTPAKPSPLHLEHIAPDPRLPASSNEPICFSPIIPLTTLTHFLDSPFPLGFRIFFFPTFLNKFPAWMLVIIPFVCPHHSLF
jgi:hypothetical protein